MPYSNYPFLKDLYENVTWDEDTRKVGIDGQKFKHSKIPGGLFDPETQRHRIHDPKALETALGDTGEGWRPPPVDVPTMPRPVQSQVSDYLKRHDASAHRQQLENLLADMPQWEQSTEQERLEAARRDAGLQIDPHAAALERAMEREKAALDAQKERALAAHAGYEADLEYALSEAAQQAMEGAIARGGGRAGLGDWKETELQKPIIAEAQRTAAQHEAVMNEIAGQKTLATQQHNEQMVELERRRGELEAQLMQEYAERDHALAAQDWGRAFEANMQLEQLDEQMRQFDAQMAQAETQFQEQQRQFDAQMAQKQADFQERQRQFEAKMDLEEARWFWEQEEADKDRVLREAEIFGELGGGNIAARDYVESMGGTIDWKRAPDGGDIITINGKDIHVQSAGGTNVGGRVQLPQNVLDAAMR